MSTEHSIIVVPSTVYNNRVMEIFQDIASTREGLSVQISKPMRTETEYVLTYTSTPKSEGLNPFTSVSAEILFSIGYNTVFRTYIREKDLPFYGIAKKQLFFSVQDFEDHFTAIREGTESAIDNLIERTQAEEVSS